MPAQVSIVQNVTINDHRAVYIHGVAAELDRSRYEPTVYLQRTAEPAQFEHVTYPLTTFPGKTYAPRGQLRFMAASSFSGPLRRADILHGVNPFSSLLPMVLRRSLGSRRPRLVYDIRGLWAEFGAHAGYFPQWLASVLDRIDVAVMRRCDRVISISPLLKDILIEKGVRGDRIDVVPGGVDLARFQGAPVRNLKEALGTRGPLVGYVGTVSGSRASQDLITAFAQARQSLGVDATLAIIGPVDGPEEFSRLLDELGVSDCVHLLGFVPHKDIPTYVKAFDLALAYLPAGSQAIFDVMVPNKLLEYLASGVPILATDRPCHAAIIEHGVDGWLTQPSIEAMADAIANLLEQPARRRALGEAAGETAERYSFTRIAELVAATYDAASS